MSYRHSSYRKVKRALEHARKDPLPAPSRTDGNRVSHWLNARPLDKPAGWGKPARPKVGWWTQVDPGSPERTLMSRGA